MRYRFLLLLAALSAASCAKPEIGEFSATPHALCYGDTSTVAWQVKGSATLDAVPPLPGTGAVEPSGTLRAGPVSDTRLTLSVKRHGKTAFARQEIVVLPTELDTFIVAATIPRDETGLEAHAVVPAQHWDASVRLSSVTNPIDRTIEVSHEGRSDTLAPGAATERFAGGSYGGEWILQAPLLPGERLGDPQHAPPEFLRLDVHLKCAN